MVILNKVQSDFYPAVKARVVYFADDIVRPCCGVVPHVQEPRHLLVELSNPSVPRATHRVVVNIRRDLIDYAYAAQRGPVPAPVDEDAVRLFIWGA